MAFRNLVVYRGARAEVTLTRLAISQRELIVRPSKHEVQELGWSLGDKLAPWLDDDTGMVRILPDPKGWKLVRSGGTGRRVDAHQVRFPMCIGKIKLFDGSPDKLPSMIIESRLVDSDGVRCLEFRLPWREGSAAARRPRKQAPVEPPAAEALPRPHRVSWPEAAGGVPTINWAYVEQAAQMPAASDAWALERLLLWAREVMFNDDVAELLVLRPPQPIPMPPAPVVETAPPVDKSPPSVDESPDPVDRTPVPVDGKPPEPAPFVAPSPKHPPPEVDAREKGRTFSAATAPAKAPPAPPPTKRSFYEDRWDAKTRWKFIEEAARGKGDRVLMDIGGCASGSLWAIKKRLAHEIAARRAAIIAYHQAKTPPAPAPASPRPPPPWGNGNGADPKPAPAPLSDALLAYMRTSRVVEMMKDAGYKVSKTFDGTAFTLNGEPIAAADLIARANEILELEDDERLVLPPALIQPQEGTTNG